MTYKETLFFIGKCLTITHEEKNRSEVKQELKNGQIDWDAVVKVSTAQYVFPALYCNLKRADFLTYLPEELVNYMKHITDLNRERNQQIINQAKEINTLLLAHNITPVFLKGTGFLLQNFYDDIAERMVGDIDFLVSDEEFKKSIEVLKRDGYSGIKGKKQYPQKFHRHYESLVKRNKIGAVEIHRKMLKNEVSSYFNYSTISNKILITNNLHYLSLHHQLILTILAKQINDYGYSKKNILLRNLYDVFLLSHNTNPKKSLRNFPKFHKEINSFLALADLIFIRTGKFSWHKETFNSKNYIKKTLQLLNNTFRRRIHEKKISITLRLRFILTVVFRSFFNADYRNYVFDRISDFRWIKEKIFGIKPTS